MSEARRHQIPFSGRPLQGVYLRRALQLKWWAQVIYRNDGAWQLQRL